MFKLSKEFFALHLDEKMKLDKSQNDHNRGYEVMYGQMIEKDTKPDLKEGYYVAQDLPPDHPQVLSKKFAHGPNLWPESLGPHIRDTCMDYLNQVTALTEKVLQAIGVSLGYDESYFDEFCTETMAFYKLLHYPPQPPDADPLQRGIGAHRDFGGITTAPTGKCPRAGGGAYVVNLGNLFQQWTNDEYRSNVHRVINRSDVDRYSIPFNYNGNPDFVIRCIESCRARPEEEKYAPISVDDYVRQKYKDVYGRVGIYSVAERAKAQAVA
ncbi:sexual differentiation process protein isp7 [Aspergillus lentulus]|uniref:Sexual differentiation process protein isp7 n=1 Tax=Aspergillus lentulus TaxID=293939 RepID=A0ABQ0ZS09_ASPLE|nr:sexual differentiation process protein isp7 [Aspergillus lentulus]